MNEDRKPHVWPWIVALMIGLPVLYVASFGPACWIAGRNVELCETVEWIYSPVLEVAAEDAGVACNGLWIWARLWGGIEGLSIMVYPPIIPR